MPHVFFFSVDIKTNFEIFREIAKVAMISNDNFVVLTENEQVAVILPFTAGKIYFKGKIRMTSVLSGGIEILGAQFHQNSKMPVEIFSPRGYSLLSLEPFKTKNEIENPEKLANFGKSDRKLLKSLISANVGNSSVFVLQKLDSNWTHYLDSGLAFSDRKRQKIALFGREKLNVSLAPEAEQVLDVNAILPENSEIRARLLVSNQQWEQAVQSSLLAVHNQVQPILVAAGGKGVGKSTMLKYIANKLIDQVGPVLWIDLDPGQAEFTLPGCISCTKLDTPILGPNFTHMEIGTEFNIYVGSVSVSDVASRYTEAIKRLLKYIKSSADLSKIPWLVNTMGFNRGLGIQLLKKSVKLIQPTTFIEIKSRFAKKNYEISLSKVAGKATFFTFQAIPESSEVKEMGVQDIWGIPEPYKLRDIVILSYLGHHFESSLQESVPFSVSFDNVSIQTLNCSRPRKQKESVMPMLNMSLVSLGTCKEDQNQKEVLGNDIQVESKGFGIIRGIDMKNRLFYILTSLPLDQLRDVNCLTCGAITLPNGVFMSKISNNVSQIPYVGLAPVIETALNIPWQRSGKPRMNETN